MDLKYRLRRLEKATTNQPGARCGTCRRLRHHKPGQIDPEMQYRVYGGHIPAPPDLGPEVCPDCGTRLVYRIKFDAGG